MKSILIILMALFAVQTHAVNFTDNTLNLGTGSAAKRINFRGSPSFLGWDPTSGKLIFSNDGTIVKKLGSGSGGGATGVNILANPTFEDGVVNWTALAGTLTSQSYTNSSEGRSKFARFVATAAAQCFQSDLAVVPDFNEFKVGMMANIERVSTSANFTFDVVNSGGTSVLRNGAVTIANSTDMMPLEPFGPIASGTQLRSRICSTAAGTLDVQSVYVGSNKDVANTSIDRTDWVNGGTIPLTAATNPGKGNVLVDRMWWRRVGDSMQIRYEYAHNTAGTGGSGNYFFGIPAGYQIDLTKTGVGTGAITSGNGIFSHNIGHFNGRWSDNTIVDHYSGHFFVANATQIQVYFQYQREAGTAASAGILGSALGFMGGPQVNYNGLVTVPIVGWKSVGAQTITNPSVQAAETVFKASIGSNGVVASENVDWINGNCVVTGSGNVYTCPVNAGIRTVAMICNVSPTSLNSAFGVEGGNDNLTSVVYQTYNGAGNAAASGAVLSCSKAGVDYEAAKVYKLKTPILVPSALSNSVQDSGISVRTESCRINNSGSAVLDTTTGLCASWIQSATRVATGLIDVVFKPGIFSAPPVCTGNAISENRFIIFSPYPATTTTVSYFTGAYGGSGVAMAGNDQPAYFTCTGRR